MHAGGQLVKVGVNLAKPTSDLVSQLQIALLDSLGLLAQLHLLEERNDVLLPEDALVLLLEVDKGVGSLAVPDVGKACLHTQAQVVTDDLQAHISQC